MKCEDPNCTRKVHFVSPEMSGTFSHAVVEKPDGTTENIYLPKPKWYSKHPLTGRFMGFDGGMPLMIDDYEIVYEEGKYGVQKDDPYYLEMDRISKEFDPNY